MERVISKIGYSAAKKKSRKAANLWSISSTYYEQLLCQNSFTKKLQSQTATREKLRKTLSYKKGSSKMLMKLTPVVNFNITFQQIFSTFLLPKNYIKA